ncbi:MAG: hypothetical protein WCH92_13875 [Betaproteobacteria bacterium]
MENLARIQRERQALELQASAQANSAATQAANLAAQQTAQANAAAAAATRQRERMIQYPRPQSTDTTPAGTGGVLSVKP